MTSTHVSGTFKSGGQQSIHTWYNRISRGYDPSGIINCPVQVFPNDSNEMDWVRINVARLVWRDGIKNGMVHVLRQPEWEEKFTVGRKNKAHNYSDPGIIWRLSGCLWFYGMTSHFFMQGSVLCLPQIPWHATGQIYYSDGVCLSILNTCCTLNIQFPNSLFW